MADPTTDPTPYPRARRGGRPTAHDDPGTQVRLPDELLDRAEALRAAVRATLPELRAVGAVSRATVIRLALLRGLDALERECADDAR